MIKSGKNTLIFSFFLFIIVLLMFIIDPYLTDSLYDFFHFFDLTAFSHPLSFHAFNYLLQCECLRAFPWVRFVTWEGTRKFVTLGACVFMRLGIATRTDFINKWVILGLHLTEWYFAISMITFNQLLYLVLGHLQSFLNVLAQITW